MDCQNLFNKIVITHFIHIEKQILISFYTLQYLHINEKNLTVHHLVKAFAAIYRIGW